MVCAPIKCALMVLPSAWALTAVTWSPPAQSSVGLAYGRLRWWESAAAVSCGCCAAWGSPSQKIIRGLAAWLLSKEALRETFHRPPWSDELPAVGAYRDLEGARVHVVESDAPGILLHCSHGFGANALSFAALFEILRDVHCVAHDHPGFGLSARPSNLGQYVLSGSVAARLGDQAFLGHSMGAVAALDAALQRKATHLVLVAPAVSTRSRSPPRIVAFLARLGAAKYLAAPTKLLLRRLVHSSPTWWRAALGACWSKKSAANSASLDAFAKAYALPSLLKGWDGGLLKFAAARLAVKGPAETDLLKLAAQTPSLRVLLVHGEQDPIVPIANSRALQAVLPAATLLALPDVGHCPHEERPDLVAKAIRDFLRQGEGGGPSS